MLQQTTFAAVRPRFLPFLGRFPDVQSLAAAGEDEVLAAWSGLGYYARARNLRRAAIEIVRDRGGVIPREPSALRQLPGFGDYMAAAMASLAFGQQIPAVEANVERVLSRLFALPGRAGSRALRDRVTSRARELLPARRAGEVTAALMDLGQLICTSRRPSCPKCPLAGVCEARRRGNPERFPGRRPRPSPIRVSLAAAVAEKDGRLLLVRRRSTWLEGLWEFPSAEADSPEKARRALARRLRPLELALLPSPPIGRARHTVVNRRIEVAVFLADPMSRNMTRRRDASWFLPAELDRAAVPTLTRKIAAAAVRGSGGYLGILPNGITKLPA
ncbi:MAG TPA: NUDIX domain-containing protein [Thermoanaerobaculia bacterium]